MESLNPLKALTSPLPNLSRRISENLDTVQKSTICPQCLENYEKELAKLAAIEKSFSEAKQHTPTASLPQWLQNAKLNTADPNTKDESHVCSV